MEDIKTCPFCDAAANLESTIIDEDTYYYVKCSACHVQSALVKVGYNRRFEFKKDVEVTAAMAIQHALGLWNARSDCPEYPWEEQWERENRRKTVVEVRRVKRHE